ncbi:MAG: hypothetical protein PVI45_13920, partial [Desulfobacterales bacterium]
AIERCKESQQENQTLKSFERMAQLHGCVTFRYDTSPKTACPSTPGGHVGFPPVGGSVPLPAIGCES